MRSLIAIFALVACTGVKAGATEEFLIRMGMYVAGGAYEGYRMSEAKERELAVMIGLKRFGPECERLSSSGELDDCGDEVLPQSMAFGKQAVEQFKQCSQEADELPQRDERANARGQCKYELEATDREFDAWSAKQKESAEED
ncbi:hypothetical protein N9C39_04755 [Luminiphilus sp.]|nr:hypothetical protein [Luminiphilus sp.]